MKLTGTSAALRVIAALAVGTLGLAACSSSTSGHAKGSSSSSSAPVVSPAPVTSSSAASLSSTPSLPSSQPVISSSPVSPIDVPSVSGIVAPDRANSPLSLSDFFNPDSNWSQVVTGVANLSGVQGIRGQLGGCGDSDELELRLQDQFHTLKFTVGQDDTSPSSDQTLVVTILVNGQQVEAKQVMFNGILKLAVNVTSANSVKIDFAIGNSSHCNEDTTTIYPVLFDATVD